MDDTTHEVQHIVTRDGEKKLIKKRGPSYWISVILAFLLFGSIIFNVILIVLLGTAAGMAGGLVSDESTNYDEVYVMGDQKSKNKILQIAVAGVIMDYDDGIRPRENIVTRVKSELKLARKDDTIKGVLLVIDSPGGGVTASDVTWNEFMKYKKEKSVPILAYCKDVTASGGYYIASSADMIMSHQTSIVGNIGVIAEFTDLHALLTKIGVEMNVIKSQTFDKKESFKDIGSPFRAMRPNERQMLQDMINEMWGRFVDVVAEGRKGKLTKDEVEKLANGSIYSGMSAFKVKLVDAVGQKEDAFEQIKKMAKVTDAQVVKYKSRFSPLQELLGARSHSGRNVQLLPDYEEMVRSQSPRLMYLWTME